MLFYTYTMTLDINAQRTERTKNIYRLEPGQINIVFFPLLLNIVIHILSYFRCLKPTTYKQQVSLLVRISYSSAWVKPKTMTLNVLILRLTRNNKEIKEQEQRLVHSESR